MIRGVCFLAIVAIVFVIIIIAIRIPTTSPSITSINPKIGIPGDIMVITGSGFGDTRDTSYVEIGGFSMTSSSYLSWTDTQIKLLLPADVQDGLVYVVTRNGQSEPVIFANRESIPVVVRNEKRTALPVVSSIAPNNASSGQILTIIGENFGSLRNNSAVYFTPQWMEGKTQPHDIEQLEQSYIAAFENDFDYEFWSDTEIRVRVPDSAISGYVFVYTDKGTSNRTRITVNHPIGTKELTGKRTYLVQLSADISDIQAESDPLITLRIPRPQPSATQPYIQLTECSPKPIFEDYNKSVIHHVQATGTEEQEKVVFTQNFVIPVYSVSTHIIPSKVTKLSEKNRLLYTIYTSPDECIPSDSPEIQNLARTIIGKEENPYLRGKLLYNYMIDNYELLPEVIQDNVAPLAMLSEKKGDAYDFAVTFCAMARAVGIPAIPVSGIIVDYEKNSKNHWWCEIYIEKFGWMPIDVALGAGLERGLFQEPENRRDFYYGNMDSQHIAFSRDWNNVKPAIINNKTVHRPKTYALQSIWEEASTGITSYSSFWSDPIVLGIY